MPLTLIAAAFLSAASLPSTPPTDKQVAAAVTTYQKGRQGSERNDPRVAAVLKDISIAELSAPQFERLGIMIDLAPETIRDQFRARLTELAKSQDADGASAAAQLPRLISLPEGEAAGDAFNQERIAAIIAAADHRGLPAAVKAGRATILYLYSYFYAETEGLKKAGVMARLASLVDESWSPAHLDDLLAFTEAAAAPQAGLDRATVDRIRKTATAIAQRIIADPATSEDARTGLLEAVAAINSAAAKGELVNHAAPPIHLLWSTAPSQPATLADLKGKVVLIDFWATWCGPCVAAFPHMRELQTRYKDAPVVLLGLTSLQGWILDPKAADPAQRRVSNLSKEDELTRLAAWAKSMDMTWTVAVSQERLFNPDYGVRGVPTVVLIDAKGIVRHADLSPTDPELTDKIDALLRELGAAVPAAK